MEAPILPKGLFSDTVNTVINRYQEVKEFLTQPGRSSSRSHPPSSLRAEKKLELQSKPTVKV